METKFTKGKFKIFEQFKAPIKGIGTRDKKYEHLSYYIQSEECRIISDVQYSNHPKAGGFGAIDNLEEMKANARLFANAPEMFEVLESALSYLNSFKNEWQEGRNILSCEIERVITKILGE